MSDHILVERGDGIATVTINRPKMRNAVSLAMWTAIAAETQALAKDDSVRAIVFRGAGTDRLRLRRRHLRVQGEPQGHRDRAPTTTSRPRPPIAPSAIAPSPPWR